LSKICPFTVAFCAHEIAEKSTAVALFNQKKIECERVLVQRGEMRESSTYEEQIHALLITIPTEILEKALEFVIERDRVNFNKVH
jgi:CO dehydrogenase/acetyl-CoA synthase beta subunit